MTELRAPRTVGEALIEVLRREGVEFLSAYPTTPLIDAAAARGLRPVLCRQERIGVGIADGYSRITRGAPPGVFAMQWGPGVENAYSGIATAFADSVPMLLLPLGYDEIKEDAQRFYTADRLRPVAKSVERLRSPGQLNDVMRRAFSRLKNGRPGPVVVEIPEPLVGLPAPELAPYEPATSVRAAGDPVAIERAIQALLAAERPIVLAGQGVLYADASAALLELAEALELPVGTTLEGKGAFPEDHPLSLGTGARAMPATFRRLAEEADVVLGVGVSFTDHPLFWGPPTGATLIHVTIDEADLNKDCRSDHPILGDAQLVLQAMAECARELLSAPRPDRRGEIKQLREDWMASWQPLLSSDATPINHYRVVAELGRVLDPQRSIVTHDSGSPRDQLTPFYRVGAPHGYLGWGKSHALGTGLGLIMGAKLAAPGKVCVHVMGDAAFGMVGLDFETAVRNGIPIVVIVLNNSTMAIETDLMPVSHERYGSRDIGGDYSAVARALGGWSRRVEAPGDVRASLQDAIRETESGRPALLEFITAPEVTPFSCKV